MIFHENRLLADDSHGIAYLIFFQNLGKMLHVIGALSVDQHYIGQTIYSKHISKS